MDIQFNCDKERAYKFGCVIAMYNRQDLLTSALDSINKSFIPKDLLFVLVDDGSDPKLDFNFSHDHIIVTKKKNYGIAHSLVIGWDIINTMPIEFFLNLDSDVEVSTNWLSFLLNTYHQTEPPCIVTGFDGKNHEVVSKNKFFKVKKTLGGINLFFHKSIYAFVRSALTSREDIPSCVNKVVESVEDYGQTPILHNKQHKGWDWNLEPVCENNGIKIVCTIPSSVQHKGYYGLNSGLVKGKVLFCETSREYKNICVPKIIHQTWKNEDLPEHLRKMQRSVVENHSDYEYKFWTDSTIDNFLRSEYPNVHEFYNKGFKFIIQKIDFIRLLFLYHFGGVYIDIDSLCVKNVDNLLTFPCSFVLAKKNPSFSESHYPIVLNNAFISSERHNDFIKQVIIRIISYRDPPDYKEYSSFRKAYTRVLKSTGPLCVTDSYKEYSFKSFINLLPSDYYFGIEPKVSNVSTESIIDYGLNLSNSINGCHFVHIHESSWWRVNNVAVKPPNNPDFIVENHYLRKPAINELFNIV